MSSGHYKRVVSRLKEHGAEPVVRQARGTTFEFPDGYRAYVFHAIENRAASAFLSDIEARYGRPARDWQAGVKVAGRPELDLERVIASEHAKERLRLMQTQRRIDLRDVLYALRLPERVLWSPKHKSWAWLRGDIAVAVTFTHDGSQVIRTILWTSDELWESNPRPEKRN